MNKYNVEAELSRQSGRRINKVYDPKEEAEKSAYYGSGSKKELIIPSEILYATLLQASSFHKIGKRSAKSIFAGSIKIEPMEVSLGTKTYVIDTRPVVIQRNRVLKSRAKLPEWKATFTIVYNEKQIANGQVIRNILEEAGERVGIMDFRPQKAGCFGTFKVTSFKE